MAIHWKRLLVSFFYLQEFVYAQITTAAVCLSDFLWMNNARNQTPCLVAAYLEGVCSNNTVSLPSITPPQRYNGPSNADGCQCNTVYYSLIAACELCQGSVIQSYAAFSENCGDSARERSSTKIPPGTAIPQWAYLDISKTNDTFSEADAFQEATSHTHGPSEVISATLGGAIGALAVIIAFVLFYFFRMRKKERIEEKITPFILQEEGLGSLPERRHHREHRGTGSDNGRSSTRDRLVATGRRALGAISPYFLSSLTLIGSGSGSGHSADDHHENVRGRGEGAQERSALTILQQAETAKADRHRESRGRGRADPHTVRYVPPARKERITQSGMGGERPRAM